MAANRYQRLPSWVLGFHGTNKETVTNVLNDHKGHLNSSDNDYDWLGGGVYFWENDPVRALQFAKERMKRYNITDQEPAVIGAIIDLGLCLNLYDQPALRELAEAQDYLKLDMDAIGSPMPKNKGTTKDRLQRYLDCAVIEHLHRLRLQAGLPEYQTVRAGFPEGRPVYAGSGFYSKNHIQIAVKDKSAIKGYFLPRA